MMKIEKPKLLLVEGKDEECFFSALCNLLKIDDIEIIATKGKDRFKSEFDAIVNAPGFEIVKSLGIIQDADDSMVNAIKSIRSSLNKHHMPSPEGHNRFSENELIRVGIFIAPGNQDNGMLESLVLQTVADHPVRIISDSYIEALREKLNNPANESPYKFPRNVHKAKLHSFLAGMEHYIPSLGIAAQKGYFDLESEALKEARDFLSGM